MGLAPMPILISTAAPAMTAVYPGIRTPIDRSRVLTSELRLNFAQDHWKVYEDIVQVLSSLHDRYPTWRRDFIG
jgi:hypothetical protein